MVVEHGVGARLRRRRRRRSLRLRRLDFEDVEKRVLAERGGDGGGEVGGDDEGGFEASGGDVFAEFHAWEEMALPEKGNDPDLLRHFWNFISEGFGCNRNTFVQRVL